MDGDVRFRGIQNKKDFAGIKEFAGFINGDCETRRPSYFDRWCVGEPQQRPNSEQSKGNKPWKNQNGKYRRLPWKDLPRVIELAITPMPAQAATLFADHSF